VKDWYRIFLSCGLLLGTLLFLHFRSYGEAILLHKSLDAFPMTVGGWQGQEGMAFEEDVLQMLRVNDYVMRRYVDPAGQSLWLYVGYWETQRKGAQMHSPKHCLPGGGWEPLEAKRVVIPLSGAPGVIEVNRYLIQKDQYQQLVLYWYQSHGQVVASEVEAKIQLVKNAIFHNRTDGALIRIISPVSGSVEETFERQASYIRELYPLLREFIPE
jgi:EpsI family protein